MNVSGNWSNKYIGIPFIDHGRDCHGCDCYGLVRLVYSECMNVELPAYQGPSACIEEIAEVSNLIDGEKQIGRWQLVDGAPQPLDVLSFRRGKYESHLGLFVSNNLMLHIAFGDCAKLENFRSGRWQHRLAGIWRYVGDLAGVPGKRECATADGRKSGVPGKRECATADGRKSGVHK